MPGSVRNTYPLQSTLYLQSLQIIVGEIYNVNLSLRQSYFCKWVNRKYGNAKKAFYKKNWPDQIKKKLDSEANGFLKLFKTTFI